MVAPQQDSQCPQLAARDTSDKSLLRLLGYIHAGLAGDRDARQERTAGLRTEITEAV
jgi:hypothetical protein